MNEERRGFLRTLLAAPLALLGRPAAEQGVWALRSTAAPLMRQAEFAQALEVPLREAVMPMGGPEWPSATTPGLAAKIIELRDDPTRLPLDHPSFFEADVITPICPELEIFETDAQPKRLSNIRAKVEYGYAMLDSRRIQLIESYPTGGEAY